MSAPDLKIAAPKVEQGGVVYAGVATDTDLAYKVTGGGLKEEVVLGSAAAPTSFSFHLSDPNGALGAATPTPGGGYVFANKVDDATVELPAPFAYEQKAAGPGGAHAPRDLSSAHIVLTKAGDGWDLVVSVDPGWLAGKSFPLVVDPTVSFSNGTAFDGSYFYEPGLHPGCPGCYGINSGDPTDGTGTYNDAYYDAQPSRTAFRFDLSSIPTGSTVTAANLNLYLAACLGTTTYYCNSHNYPVELHAFTGPWNAATATWDTLKGITAAGSFGGYSQPAFGTLGWVPPIGMTAQVQSWVSGAANNGFALMLPAQPANWGGPAYGSADSPTYPHPYLSVTYNLPPPPAAPTAVTAVGANTSARVTWTPPAPNGSPAIDSYAINVYNPDSSFTGIQVQACSTCTSVSVPGLTNGRAYFFGVFAHNSGLYGPPGYSGFATPAVPPAAPMNLQGTVSTGWYHTLIGRPDGTVAAFGLNSTGQLGNNTVVDAHLPTVVPGLSGVVQVAAGYAHSLALKADGTVWAWGYNNYGQLGNNTVADSHVPIQVPGLTGVVSISTSYAHNLALKADGTAWAWGWNANGELGNNTTVDSHVPVQVPGLANLLAVSAGYGHSLALRADGSVWAFGLNNVGQLGNNTVVDTHAPIQVPNIVSAVAVSAGLGHSVALRGDGAVWDWGQNGYGQLGNNSTVDAHTALIVPGISGVTNITADGGYDTMARKADGTLWAWGYNGSGQLGINSTVQSIVPVQVPGLAGVTQVSAGLYHTLAVKADGGIGAFGYNAYGQLGNNATVDAHTAVAPTGPGQAPQSPSLAAAGGAQQASVTWAAPAVTGGDPVSSYTISLYQGTPGSGTLAASQSCNACSSSTFQNLTVKGQYYTTVAAVTGVGAGPAASSAPVLVGTAPGAPGGLQAVVGALSALLSWTAPPANGAPITRFDFTATDTAGGPILQMTCADACLTSGSTLFTGLTPGHTYNFASTATNAIGTGPTAASGTSGLILTADALTPTGVAAGYYDDGKMSVTWQESPLHIPLITTYVIRAYLAPPPANGGPPPSGTPIISTVEAPSPGTTAVVGGLTDGTPYYATVEARTLPNLISSGQSSPSNVLTVAGKPSAPTSVTASRGDTQSTVTWVAPYDHGNAIKNYRVKVYTALNRQLVSTTDGDASPRTIGGLINGTAYYFTVVATNDVGSSPESDASPTVTPAGLPFTPTGVTASAGHRQATVNWQPAGNNGDALTGNQIIVSPPCGGCQGLNPDGNANSTVITGLHPGSQYTFSVIASNSIGSSGRSTESPQVTLPPEVPSPPANVHAAADTSGRVAVTWDASDDNGSTIIRYTVTASDGTSQPTSGTAVTFTGLTAGTSYTFSVVATNGIGDSTPPAVSNAATPAGVPSAPGGITVTSGFGSATVSWTPSNPNGSPLVRYIVYADGQPGATTDGSATTAGVDHLSTGRTYAFTVTATNDVGPGPSSEAVSGTIPAPKYVALGDSYSSGNGSGVYDPASGSCRRSEVSYPRIFADNSRYAPLTFIFPACNGDLISDVYSSQLAHVPPDAALVTITIGGNDVHFGDIITDCVESFFACNDSHPELEGNISNLLQPLTDLYRAIQSRAPFARVIILTYPIAFSRTVPACNGELGVSDSERTWIIARTTQLDEVIATAAYAAGVSVLREDSAFYDHEVCTPEPYMNGVAPSDKESSFHPTASGYLRMGQDLQTAVGW